MNFVAAAPPSLAAIRSLPPLGGGLLLGYRLVWWLLALGSVATLSWLMLSPDMSSAILTLRLAKGAVLIAVSTILYRRRQRDVVAALMSSAFLLWTITSSFDVTSGDAPLPAALADHLRFLLFALALLLFPSGQWSPSWTRHIASLSATVFALGIAETLGWLQSQLFLPLAIVCVLAAIGSLFYRFRFASSMVERQQSKWIALGLGVGITLILAARAGAGLKYRDLLDPLIIETLFQLGVVAIAIGFLVSLLRYRLYDAESVISRSAAYAGLTLALVGTFAASESLIQTLGQRYFGPEIGDLSGGIAAAIAAILLTPLNSKISGWAEQRFQRDLIGLKTQLPDLLSVLSGSASLTRFGSAVLPHIEVAVHPTRIALVVDGRVVASQHVSQAEARRWLRRWDAPSEVEWFDRSEDGLFPLRLALRCPLGSVRAWLLLGPRPDGSFYSRDELDALQFIAAPLQRTLFAVAERQQTQARERRLLNAMARAIRSLDTRVSAVEGRSSAAQAA
jgi:hypothetical protein